MMKLFKVLSDVQLMERKEIDNLLKIKMKRKLTEKEKIVAESYLVVKGVKDRLLHENIMNLALKLHPVLAFS
jgi:hypothetical protein